MIKMWFQESFPFAVHWIKKPDLPESFTEGNMLTDSELLALKQEYHNQGWQHAARWYVEVDKRGTNFEEGLLIKEHFSMFERSKQPGKGGEEGE